MKKTKAPPSARNDEVPLSVAVALKFAREDLVVKASSEFEVGEDSAHSRHFMHIRIASFKDVQRLSFVPEGLDMPNTTRTIPSRRQTSATATPGGAS